MRGKIPLFTELPRRGLLGNRASGTEGSRKPGFRHCGFRKVGLLHPAPHTRLVFQVLLAEDAFQVLLLALDLVALDYVHHQRQ
jgi:hypothetical protein